MLTENKTMLLYISITLIFAIVIRLIWVYQFNGVESFHWNGQFMINTNDGYYFAEGARDILNWTWQENSLSPINNSVSQLTALFAFILPFSFESIIFYMSSVLSSLIVIPLILIAKELKFLHVGVITALLSSIAWSYYNRTMIGYFDTDMLNIIFPVFLLWSLILALKTQKNIYLLFTALEVVAYRWWYPQSYSLEVSFFGLILLYTLVYERKSIYHYKLLSLMLIAMIGLPDMIRILSVIAVYIMYKKHFVDRYIYHFFGLSFLLFLTTGGVEPIWLDLQRYVFNASTSTMQEGLKLHFFLYFKQ